MADIKKRMSMSMGITLYMQSIDEESNIVVQENFVNNWGGRYERLDQDEAILFQNALLSECVDEYQALEKKAMAVAAKFGLDMVGETSDKPGKPVR